MMKYTPCRKMAADLPQATGHGSSVCVVLQQCVTAKLQLNASDGASPPDPPVYAEIGQGMVVFVSFKKGCNSDVIAKVAKAVLEVKLSYDGERLGSILDVGGDILIIPQACIGGKLKGKNVQYHSLVGKDEGQALYLEFVQVCKELVAERPSKVLAGTYGNRQVLSMDTNGPFTHVFNF